MKTAREEYAEAHAEYVKAMYELLITDENLYNKINLSVVKLATVAFAFGNEAARQSVGS